MEVSFRSSQIPHCQLSNQQHRQGKKDFFFVGRETGLSWGWRIFIFYTQNRGLRDCAQYWMLRPFPQLSSHNQLPDTERRGLHLPTGPEHFPWTIWQVPEQRPGDCDIKASSPHCPVRSPYREVHSWEGPHLCLENLFPTLRCEETDKDNQTSE